MYLNVSTSIWGVYIDHILECMWYVYAHLYMCVYMCDMCGMYMFVVCTYMHIYVCFAAYMCIFEFIGQPLGSFWSSFPTDFCRHSFSST